MGRGRLVLSGPAHRGAPPGQDPVLHQRDRRDLLLLNGVAVLCGGFGAARFLSGWRAAARVGEVQLTCVVNTADDLTYAGLHISPDVDSVSYALAGRFDEERGFGLAGDTFGNAAALRRFGLGWFGVGDEDLARHLARTGRLAGGATLSEATAAVTAALGPAVRVLPMSDDPVRTTVTTPQARLSFQDYLVQHRAEPPVVAVDHDGLDAARPAPGVLEALDAAAVVILAPSNPVSSIGPILGLAGVREVLTARSGPTVAVSPVVSGIPPGRPAERSRAVVRAAFMAARGRAHTATAVAAGYAGLVRGFVLDRRDAGERGAVEDLGLAVLVADTLAPPAAREALVAEVLAFAAGLRPAPSR